MEIFEQLARVTDTEWLRRCSPIEDFERAPASIAVGAGDAMKFRVVDVGGGLQRTENYCPANLQCAQITLSKCSSRKVEGRDRELAARQAAQVIGKQSNFLQLCRRCRDRFTNICKREKFGLQRRMVGTARCAVRTSQRDVPTSKIQL